MIEVRPVQTNRERNIFITFPWRIYKKDPLWIPPILSEREKEYGSGSRLIFQGRRHRRFLYRLERWQAGRNDLLRAGKRCKGKYVWLLRMPRRLCHRRGVIQTSRDMGARTSSYFDHRHVQFGSGRLPRDINRRHATVPLHCYAVITRHIIRVSLNAIVLDWNMMTVWLMPLIST